MTDTETPAEQRPVSPLPQRRTGRVVGLGLGGGIVYVALVTTVLMVSLNVLGSTGLPSGAAERVLLNSSDLAKINGVEIATGADAAVKKSSLRAYVNQNAAGSSNTVTPSHCADNLEGWMAWKSLDNPSYRGWRTDVIFEASNIVVNATSDYENGLQEARHFATVSAATAFMSAQRGWYRSCATSTYTDPKNPSNDVTYAFSPITLDLGLDAVIEGSTNTGKDLPPHLIDVYLRNKNIVYVTELVTLSPPQHGMDPVSLAIVKSAANKLAALN